VGASHAFNVCPPNGPIRGLPHALGWDQRRTFEKIEPADLEFELFYTCLVRCDCGTFDTNGVLEDGFRGFYGDFIVRSIPMLQTKIVVFDVEIQVWKNQLLGQSVSAVDMSENVVTSESGVIDVS
jgi:hypothetical protein